MVKNRKICKQVRKILLTKSTALYANYGNTINTITSSERKTKQYYSQYQKFLPMAYTHPWKAMQDKYIRGICMDLTSVH
jgi:hypothetical protein